MTIKEMRDKRAKLLEEAAALRDKIKTEKRDFNAEETKRIDEILAECKTLKADADKAEADEQRAADLDAELADLSAPQGRRTAVQPDDNRADGPTTRIEHAASIPSHGNFRAFKFENSTRNAANAHAFGQWIQTVAFGRRAKSWTWCQENIPDFRALTTTSNISAGYLVPDQFNATLIRLVEEYGVFRQNASVVPMASDTAIWPRRTAGVTAYFVGENTEPTESTPTTDQVQLTAKKLASEVKASNEILEDSAISIGDWLMQEFALAFALKEDQCGFIGDGTSTYGGMFGLTQKLVDGTRTASLVTADGAANSQDTFGELSLVSFENLVGAYPMFAGAQPKWYISKVGYWASMARVMYAAGGNTADVLAGGGAQQFLGYPVVFSQVLPAGLATDYSAAAMCLFGDLKMASTLGTRRQFSVKSSTERYFELDQTIFLATERFDIVNHELGSTTAAGSIMALIGN